MRRITASVSIFLAFVTLLTAQNNYTQKNGVYYFTDKLVVKFNPTYAMELLRSNALPAELEGKFDMLGEFSAVKRFERLRNTDRSTQGLERIFVITYSSPVDPFYASSKIKTSEGIEWAEPYFLYELALVPNDPFFISQYALAKIEAESAWEIDTGDPEIIIAINDTGVDWDHPDLAGNIWQNDDPINGIDDDGNEYIDDLRGWDFGGLAGIPDNDPMEDRPDHGTHVAGIASAVTDNGTGVASIGFNCTIMPVKTSQDNIRNNQGLALIAHGYDGLIYAADNGADVINCSWGGFGFSILGQETVDYVLSKGTLIVAAAGNDGIDDIIYPAGYDGVLSVGSTNSSDTRSGFSNHGIKLDVLAPGSSIYGTWQNNTYTTLNGTSMSSPLAAGLAGLVFNQFPGYNPRQVAEQIRVNSDNIDNLNPGFEYLLGSGRINAYKALFNANSKSVRIKEFTFIDDGDGDGIFEPGEDVSVILNCVNYLSPTSSLSITAESISPQIQFSSSSFTAGAFSTMEEFTNSSNPIRFSIAQNTPSNTILQILIKFTDSGYSDFQWISTILNPTYSTQGANKVALTITSRGALGFNDFPNTNQGDGFKYDNGTNLLFEGALMYGVSATQVMNAARESQTQSDDFTTVTPFTISVPGNIADQQGFAAFTDDGAGANKLGIKTELHSYTFTDDENEDYIILDYRLINHSGNTINGLRAGLFFDWDLIDGSGNGDITRYDQADDFAYVYNGAGGPETNVGIALLSEGNTGYYGISNGGGGSFSIYDGFSNAEKWLSLSEGVSNPSLPAGDISLVFSGGTYNISPNDSVKTAFVIAAGNNLEELREAIQQSRIKYASIITGNTEESIAVPEEFSLLQNYPNPFNPSTKIDFTLPREGYVSLKVFNLLGEEISTLIDGRIQPGKHSVEFDARDLTSGVYFYKLKAGEFVSTKKMILLR